jgi:hypothetical protein
VALRRPRPRAVWFSPLPAEDGAPLVRIGHSVHAGLAEGTRVSAVGFRGARAYHKCGSRIETDWVRDVRVLALWEEGWREAWSRRDLPRAHLDSVRWIDIDVVGASALMVEVRRSWVDDWWPGWNLAEGAVCFRFEGGGPRADAADRPPRALPLDVVDFDLTGLPKWLSAVRRGGSLMYEAPKFAVGFRLGRPELSWLSVRSPQRLAGANLLALPGLFDQPGPVPVNNIHHPLRGHLTQGTRLTEADGYESIGFLSDAYHGEVSVRANRIRYVIEIPRVPMRYELDWEIEPTGLTLSAVRSSELPARAVESSAWQFAFDSRTSPLASMAAPRRFGETGMAEAGILAHLPGFGSWRATPGGSGSLRFDAARPFAVNTLELKVGETESSEGDYRLPAGQHAAELRLMLTDPLRVARRPQRPVPFVQAVERTGISGLAYRLDTAALSNNGASQHVPFCMDMLASLAVAIRPFSKGFDPLALVRDSIDRYLRGAPGYGAGPTSHGEFRLEDEYVMTRPAVLLGIAILLGADPDRGWLADQADAIGALIEQTRALDVDADGLIESSLRTGVTGRGAASSNWWDEISFGWKDAFSNAILFDGLVRLASIYREFGEPDRAASLEEWAASLKAAYLPTFLHAASGWLAGWRSEDGELHDHAFLFVNGAAVSAGLLDPEMARGVMGRLWEEVMASGLTDHRLGLPGNLRRIPDADTPGAYPDLPFGYYQNGGVSLSMARHFIGALYDVGMSAEGDALLLPMLEALADGTAFGGVGTGIDWRFWDGGPCGYEGLLSDQFGILIPAIERFGDGRDGEDGSSRRIRQARRP